MKKTSKKILFFGNERLATGVHATASTLQALLASGYEVAAVVVAQRPAGQSRRTRPLEVAVIAEQQRIPLLAPNDLNAARGELAAFSASAAVLVAYGRIVPQSVLDLFPCGIINVHPSLLPRHRGSTPIESAILDGDQQSGVSLMRLAIKMDAGPLYDQQAVELNGTETKQNLADQLAAIGVDMVLEYLPKALDGSVKPTPQAGTPTYDHLISKADGPIDWHKPADRLEREIRAYAGWPGSRTTLAGKEVIITQAHAVPLNDPAAKPGDIETLKQGVIMIECGVGYLCIDKLKPAGKSEMSAKAFLAGYKLS
jgi:methionyl-tRNA formyltransferase